MTTDEKVVWEAVNKDLGKGFKLLMTRYGKPVYWHVRRLVVSHEDAQDATQEAFIRIFRSMGQLNADSSLTAWIYRIATNEALRLLEQHKAGNVPLDEAGTAAWNALGDDEYVDYSDLESVKLQRAILSLPAKQQVAFNLRYYDNLGYDDIAAVTGTTAAAAKMNYHLAKNKIIEYMNSHD